MFVEPPPLTFLTAAKLRSKQFRQRLTLSAESLEILGVRHHGNDIDAQHDAEGAEAEYVGAHH